MGEHHPFQEDSGISPTVTSSLQAAADQSVVEDVTRILSASENGDQNASAQLLPLVYGQLRELAAAKLANERPGQTLQATALVHEAYIRLVDVEKVQHWDSLRHFFAAAAEAMRRILVENARKKRSLKAGGRRHRVDFAKVLPVDKQPQHDLVELSELIDQLATADARAAELVKLRFFAGLTGDQSAEVLGISPRSADFLWKYAKAWLFEKQQSERT
jgi:RNA polymerase sigma factor (TIGR02999 family)